MLGGPILRIGNFFFFSAEALRLTLPQTFVGTVPDLASRAWRHPSYTTLLEHVPATQGRRCRYFGRLRHTFLIALPIPIRPSAEAYSLRVDHQVDEEPEFVSPATTTRPPTTSRGAPTRPRQIRFPPHPWSPRPPPPARHGFLHCIGSTTFVSTTVCPAEILPIFKIASVAALHFPAATCSRLVRATTSAIRKFCSMQGLEQTCLKNRVPAGKPFSIKSMS